MRIPIHQMNSFSRSGETLMLRTLEAHPNVHVVHQIREPDTAEDLALFRALMTRTETGIDADDPLVRHKGLRDGDVLVLKNAVWIHPAPWRGFVFIRDPFSVMASARVTDRESPKGYRNHKEQCGRWGRGIDPALVPFLMEADNLTAFCVLYARKMIAAWASGRPILRYEEFVTDPEPWLRRLLADLGLGWDDAVMTAHEGYAEGETGHGGIPLWKPIHPGSVERYRSVPAAAFDRIYALTARVLDLFGYEVAKGGVALRPISHRFQIEC